VPSMASVTSQGINGESNGEDETDARDSGSSRRGWRGHRALGCDAWTARRRGVGLQGGVAGRARRSAGSRALTSGRLGRPGAGSRAGAPWRLAREREKRGEREGEIRGERERAQGAAATVGARRRQGRALGVNGPLVGLRVRGFFFFSK
jgi:hypothetical protein